MQKTHRVIEADSMKPQSASLMSDEEWLKRKQAAKAAGKPVSDADYNERYKSLLDRYGIKKAPSGAMEMQASEDPKTVQSDKEDASGKDEGASTKPIIKNDAALDAEKETRTHPNAKAKAKSSYRTPSKAPNLKKTGKSFNKANKKPADAPALKNDSKQPDNSGQKSTKSFSHRDTEENSMKGIDVPKRKLTISDKLSIKQAEIRARQNKQLGIKPGRGSTLSGIKKEYQEELLKNRKKQ